MRRLGTVAWLTVLWVLLWRDASVANVASGVVVGAAVELLQPGRRERTDQHVVRPLALLAFVGFFAVKLVESNLVLAREVVTPRNRIRTGVVEVALHQCSELVVTLVANAVSLTPGTLTLEVRQLETPTLYVHVLHLHDVERARADVLALADRAAAAFPTRDALPSTAPDHTRADRVEDR